MLKPINGAKIKTLREKRKMLQQELADKLGVDRTAVTKWESGATAPKTDMLPALAKVLKCKIEDLYKEV